jgi:hypothetical protein
LPSPARPRPRKHADFLRTEVDGVPTFFARSSGPVQAGLVFRVGTADEALPRRGMTHLVEHLALSDLGAAPHAFNAATGRVFTSFVVRGDSVTVRDHLRSVAEALAQLPTERLDHERRVLEVEAAGRVPSELAAWRWGPSGFGLTGYDELGLPGLAAADLQSWATTRFTRSAAALWLTGPPPRGLRLPLPRGEDVADRELPDPYAAVTPTPSWFPRERPGLVFSYLAERGACATMLAGILNARLVQRLRHEQGLVYSIGAGFDRLTAEVAEFAFGTDGSAEAPERLVQQLWPVLDALRNRPPDEAEMRSMLQTATAQPSTPDETYAGLQLAAENFLLGRVTEPRERYLQKLQDVRPEQIAAAAQEAFRTLLLGTSSGSSLPAAFAAPAPVCSETSLPGPAVEPRPGVRSPQRLIVSPAGLTAEHGPDARVTVRFDRVAAVIPFSDGSRVLIGQDGFSLPVLADQWPDPDALRRHIDAHLPTELFVAERPRDVAVPAQPTGRQRRLEQLRDRPVAWLAVLLGILLASYVSRTDGPAPTTPVLPGTGVDSPPGFSGLPGDLNVGDCALTTSEPGDVTEPGAPVDCALPHNREVYARITINAGQGTREQQEQTARQACLPLLSGYSSLPPSQLVTHVLVDPLGAVASRTEVICEASTPGDKLSLETIRK